MSESTPETEQKPTEATEQTEQRGDPAAEQLGEGGKKALDAERNARKAAEKAAADLKAELDKINRANESAIEKANREAKEAQDVAARATTDVLRYRIASETGITEHADLILTGSDEETMRKQAKLWADRTPTGPKPDPSQGAKGTAGARTTADSFAEYFRNHI